MNKFGFLLQLIVVTVAILIALHYSGHSVCIIRKVTELAHGKPGCAPVPDVGNITLHYFKGRGRAEPIRLLMEEAGLDYVEVSFDGTTWPEYKMKGIQSGLYTFGQVPAVETTTGIRLVQSHVIAHYLGRATGMDCDCEDLHICHLLAAGADDARRPMSSLLYGSGYTLKDRDAYLKDTLPMWLGHFEKLAPSLSKQTEAYFASGRVTWVDFVVFDLLETNMEFASYDFGKTALKIDNLLDNFPKLKNFFIRLADHPNIAQYLHSKRRQPYKVSSMPVDAAKY